MQEHIQSVTVRYPGLVYTSAATVFAFAALSPTPSFVSLIGLLTTMRLSAWTFLPRPNRYIVGLTQALFVAVASAAVHLAPSLDALSTPNESLMVLGIMTFLTSCLSYAVVFLGCYGVRFTAVPWSQLTLFPALWASYWGFMSSVSPVGQLVTWSPVIGLGPYTWLRPILGQWGIDWVAAAWAVVFSETIGNWIVGSPEEQEGLLVDQQPLLIDHNTTPNYHSIEAEGGTRKNHARPLTTKSKSLIALTGMLSLLALPSYSHPYLPLPISSPEVSPFSVACIMPKLPNTRYSLTLNDYVKETQRHESFASTVILLWPESAVSFSSPAEKDAAFEHIQKAIHNKKYVGVSFEDIVPAGANGKVTKRNGFALLGKTGPPLIEYYKRNLVPIAESFSMIPGTQAPEIYTLDMGTPNRRTPGGWAPAPNHTRPIGITASICLDFASSSSFTSLSSRPAVILAPAKTWHVGVGYAMWEQAKARAAETSSTVVWCDGGDGGIGGIASGDYSEVVQRGSGTWTRTFPLPYPLAERPTFYMEFGQYAAFGIVWAVVASGYGVKGSLALLTGGRHAATGALRLVLGRIRAIRQPTPAQASLLD